MEAGLYRLHALLGRILERKARRAAAAAQYRESVRGIAKSGKGWAAAVRARSTRCPRCGRSTPGSPRTRRPPVQAEPARSERERPVRWTLMRRARCRAGLPARDRREVARITAENARLVQRLGEGERRFRLISRGVLRIQEAERGRISRELHDGVGQSLTALKMQLELLAQAAAGEGSALRPGSRTSREMADRSLQDVRQFSHLLRPQMLDELGLVPTLRWLARTFEQRTGSRSSSASRGSTSGPTRTWRRSSSAWSRRP